ncbi:Imm26 family immunity protein [Actinokineospora sp.]|uniref:Imm26 family immunity protein n=1 Tax=Actinokineospora sp. TaxID=1872133 RepID=UPI003D6BF8DD
MARRGALGTVVEIPFGNGARTYARLVTAPYIAVYDCRVDDGEGTPGIDEIIACPILFFVGVFDAVWKSGRWRAVGTAPGAQDLAVPDTYMQDIADPTRCTILDAHGGMRPATIEECEGLERAAVWEAEQVERRIADHYAGRPNADVEHFALKR